MRYLLIENNYAVKPDIRTITVLGASSNRGKEEKIGQFGSGFLYTLALFARKDLLSGTNLFVDKKEYVFVTKNHGSLKTIAMVHLGENESEDEDYDLNISTEFGIMDWHDTSMGLRELISNAIDGAGDHDKYTVRMVDSGEEAICGTAGKISVYVDMIDEVADYYQNLTKHFLMLRNNYDPDKRVIQHKEKRGARFYRKGVLCGELKETNSLFDYNIKELSLKESRVIDNYEAEKMAAMALRDSDVETLCVYLKAMLNSSEEEGVWETKLSDRHMSVLGVYGERRHEITNNWVSAYKEVWGTKVPIDNTLIQKAVESKGFKTVACNSKSLLQTLRINGIKTAEKILSADEREGRKIISATQACHVVLDNVWQKLVQLSLVSEETEKPKLRCFDEILKCEGSTLGFQKDGTVYINSDIAAAKTFILTKVMLEEVAHYITGAEDFTRDFQDYAFRVAAKAIHSNS